MNYREFADKWCPAGEDVEFIEDLLSTAEYQFQNAAIDVLSDIPGSELILDNIPGPDSSNGYCNGRIMFSKKGEAEKTGTIIYYSPAVGIKKSDWYQLLFTLIKNAI